MQILGSKITAASAISFVLLLIAPFTTTTSANAPMVFGVYSEGKPNYYDAYWESLVEKISLESGQNIRLESAKSAEEFEQKLSDGSYDFVLLNAHLYTEAHDTIGYQAFAKEKDQKDKGVIVVHQDSDIHSLAQLKSKSIVMSDPNRYTSTVFSQAQLKQQGIPVNLDYVDNDRSVYHAVVHKDAVAGAGEIKSLNGINPSAHSKLRVIWSSKQYSSNAFAAHPRVPEDRVARVKQALMALNSDSKGKRLLVNLKFKGIDSASDNEWNDVRELKRHLSR
jgi:phosphonate transport system substrate-binding protein